MNINSSNNNLIDIIQNLLQKNRENENKIDKLYKEKQELLNEINKKTKS